MMDDENTTPRGGGGLGALFSGARGRLLLIGGGIIGLLFLVKHYSQPVSAAHALTGGGTTIYEPTILSGGSGGGGPQIPVDHPIILPRPKPKPVGLTFDQWIYQFKTIGRGGPGLAADMHNISIDPQLTAAQKSELENLYGGGPAPRGRGLGTWQHPAGSESARLAPIAGHPYGGY